MSKESKSIFARTKQYIEDHLPTLLISIFAVTFLLLYFWSRIFITIKAGESGVLYKRFGGGTVVESIYGEGFHLIYPWDIMAIYNLRVQTNKHSLNVLTEGGLNVKINMAIRYHPDREMVGVLHKFVGQDYFEIIVLPEIEATVRSYVVKDNLTDIYATLAKKSTFQDAVNEAIGRVARKFVTIDDVMIIDIELPSSVRSVIQEKLQQQQLSLAYGYRIAKEKQEAERKRIEAEGINTYNEIIGRNIDDNILKWQGILATSQIATSNNAKVIMIGPDKNSLPVILNAESSSPRQSENANNTPKQPWMQDNDFGRMNAQLPSLSFQSNKQSNDTGRQGKTPNQDRQVNQYDEVDYLKKNQQSMNKASTKSSQSKQQNGDRNSGPRNTGNSRQSLPAGASKSNNNTRAYTNVNKEKS